MVKLFLETMRVFREGSRFLMLRLYLRKLSSFVPDIPSTTVGVASYRPSTFVDEIICCFSYQVKISDIENKPHFFS